MKTHLYFCLLPDELRSPPFILIRTPSLRSASHVLNFSLIAADTVMMTKSWILVVNAAMNGPYLGNAGKTIDLKRPYL